MIVFAVLGWLTALAAGGYLIAGAVTANLFSKGFTGRWSPGFIVMGALGGLIVLLALANAPFQVSFHQ